MVYELIPIRFIEESDAADAPLPAKRGARSARNPGLLDEYAVDEGRNSSRYFQHPENLFISLDSNKSVST